MLRPYTNVRPGLIVKDTRWETRLLALVAAVLVVFGLTAVYGASSLLTISGGQGGSSFALKQALGAAGGGVGCPVVGRPGFCQWARAPLAGPRGVAPLAAAAPAPLPPGNAP